MSDTSERILLIGDEFVRGSAVLKHFEKAGFEVCAIRFSVEELMRQPVKTYAAIVTDCSEIASNPADYLRDLLNPNKVPVIIISPENDVFNHILSLEMGAEDYIVKPYDCRVLVARTKAAVRRSGKISKSDEREISCEGLYINHSRYLVEVEDTPVNMPLKEFELLYLFASNPNHVFSRAELLGRVWGFEFNGKSRTVDVHIKRLRAKVERENLPWHIATVWGVGYKFEIN